MKSETFIERLERLLSERGMQQKDIAALSGMSQNGVSSWKVSGAIPRADVALRIASALNVSPEYLIFGEIKNLDPETNELAYEVAALSAEKKSVIKALIDALDVF